MLSAEEYLRTPYDPDVEFVDGAIRRPHSGDWAHALIQSNVLFALRRKYPHLKVVAELRSSVTGTRFRLPDVCVVLHPPSTKYLRDPAFLVVEVLSEGDVMSSVIEKLREYAEKGVPNIWLIDPRLRLIWTYHPPALAEVESDMVAERGRCRTEPRRDLRRLSTNQRSLEDVPATGGRAGARLCWQAKAPAPLCSGAGNKRGMHRLLTRAAPIRSFLRGTRSIERLVILSGEAGNQRRPAELALGWTG